LTPELQVGTGSAFDEFAALLGDLEQRTRVDLGDLFH